MAAGLIFHGGQALSAQTVTNITSRLLPQTNLMVYRDASGQVRPVRTVEDWLKRRALILHGMQEVMGPLPGPQKRCPLQMEVVEESDAGSFVRRLIAYSPEPRGRIPAYLLIPKAALGTTNRAFPAVLALHPTDSTVGHKVVVGLGSKANRDYGRELAERGYVVLAPAYPLLANYQPDLKALQYQSGTMKAIWDNIRSLDLLSALPYVKTNAFGAMGHSLGGHNALYTAVFDPRIEVVVSSCGFDSFLDYMGGNIKGWTSDRYMPNLLKYRLETIPFDFHEVIGALAPRACFVSAPFYDDNFKWRSVYQIEEAAARVYELYNEREQLRVEHPNCAHDFPEAMRTIAYQIFDKRLKERP